MLAETVKKKTGLTLADAENAINAALEAIKSIPENTRIELRNFGTFARVRSTQVNKHNPKTGEKVPSSEFTTIRFKPSDQIRES